MQGEPRGERGVRSAQGMRSLRGVDAREELTALLQLRALPGLSDRRLRWLLDRYGSARGALGASADELGERAAALRGARPVVGRVERSLEVLDRLEVRVLTGDDPAYPALFRQLHDPPAVVFGRGRLELIDEPTVAVVGARLPTAYGHSAATELARGLGRAGVVVVSGMARGIDAAAHRAALETGTIGILGCGIDVVYPREHGHLFQRVADRGLLLTEFAPGEPALRYHFPRRNRLIAALSLGVLVVEASSRSGSLITVEHALDLGREVFAVPGPIGRETSAGTNALIRDGARLVTAVRDVLEELGLPVPAGDDRAVGAVETPAELSGLDLALWRTLGTEPRHIDDLAAAAGLDAASALSRLLVLELGGRAHQLAGARFVRA